MIFTRRRFLRTALSVAAGAAFGELCPRNVGAAQLTDGFSATFDALSGGQPLGLVPFSGEGPETTEVAVGAGLDGRLYTDLTWLGPRALVTPTERFFVRTRVPAMLDLSRPWSMRVRGLVERETTFTLDELRAIGVRAAGAQVLECSGNGRVLHFGMLGCATFDGVPVFEVLKRSRPAGAARRIIISGFDEHQKISANSEAGASWVFTPEQLESSGALLATSMNGVGLTLDHGAPVRLLVPGWYGCTCIKWVNEIRWVDDDAMATLQMMEFAERTHQIGKPAMARDYRPATMDQAAMPIRVEKWKVDGKLVYRIVGITWGGSNPSTRLVIRCVPRLPSDAAFSAVRECAPRGPGQPWSLWSALWRPAQAGSHALQLMVNEPGVITKRLSTGFYTRTVDIREI